MPFSIRQPTKKQFLALSLIVIAAAVAMVIGLRKKNADEISGIAPVRPPTAGAQTSARNRQDAVQIEHALITLTPRGFYPTEITRPKGLFLLAVDNRIGNQEIVFRLTRDNGSMEKEKSLVKGQLRWREVVDLNPGNYVLTEVNHPDWICNINIVAQ